MLSPNISVQGNTDTTNEIADGLKQVPSHHQWKLGNVAALTRPLIKRYSEFDASISNESGSVRTVQVHNIKDNEN
jgi:hypothetical protein